MTWEQRFSNARPVGGRTGRQACFNAKGRDSGLSSSNQVFTLDSVEIVLQIKLHSPREEIFTYPPHQRGIDPVCIGAMKRWGRFWDRTVSHLAIGNHRYCTGSFMPGLSKRNSGRVAIHVCKGWNDGKDACDGSQDRNLSEYRWGLQRPAHWGSPMFQ
jgi:hypothetical protein